MTELFSDRDFDDHEHVSLFSDQGSGLRCIIAIHDTTRGPALGGTRMWSYPNDGAALTDALRLSRGMTYKSALAELPLGGGKAVILADARTDKTEALWHAYGQAVERLGGRYITAEDVGVTVSDLQIVRQQTRHVAGIPEGGAGDPSPATARGVFVGMRAAVRHALGRDDFEGLRVAVQGLGAVGWRVCEHLAAAGARLLVADVDRTAVDQAVDQFGAQPVEAEHIHAAEAEIYAPCALGAVINDRTIPQIRARIVAGSANNQLAEARHGEALRDRAVLYAPDYAINAGGIINISHEGPGYDRERAFAHVDRIEDTMRRIFEIADQQDIATSAAADRLAEQRLAPTG